MCVHGFVSVCVDRDCAHLSPKSECTNSFPVMHSQVKTNKQHMMGPVWLRRDGSRSNEDLSPLPQTQRAVRISISNEASIFIPQLHKALDTTGQLRGEIKMDCM